MKKGKEKVRKNDPKTKRRQKEDKNIVCLFFKCSLSFRAHALQSEFNNVCIFNFVKLRLQNMSFKIEQAFEKTKTIFHQNRAKKDIY